MNKNLFKVLVPLYIIYAIVHAILFVGLIMYLSITESPAIVIVLPLLMISHFLVIILGIVFWILMLIDCAKREFKNQNNKIVWIIIVALLSTLGAIIYFYVHGKKPLTQKS